MDLTILIAVLKGVASIPSVPAWIVQLANVLIGLFNAWPAIQAGVQSEQPFFDAIKAILSNGGEPLPAGTLDSILAGIQSQEDTVAAEIAADDKTTSSNGS